MFDAEALRRSTDPWARGSFDEISIHNYRAPSWIASTDNESLLLFVKLRSAAAAHVRACCAR